MKEKMSDDEVDSFWNFRTTFTVLNICVCLFIFFTFSGSSGEVAKNQFW